MMSQAEEVQILIERNNNMTILIEQTRTKLFLAQVGESKLIEVYEKWLEANK